MIDQLVILLRGSPETLAFFFTLTLLEMGKWIDRFSLRRVVSAIIGKTVSLGLLDEILDRCEHFVDISHVSNCLLSLPRKSNCKIIRLKTRYHHLFKEKLLKQFWVNNSYYAGSIYCLSEDFLDTLINEIPLEDLKFFYSYIPPRLERSK